MLLKIHNAYRKVVALCDEELLNKTFKENKMQMHINEHFFKGHSVSEQEALIILKNESKEDATFNIVGEKSVNTALKSGIINKGCIKTIQDIPIALILL